MENNNQLKVITWTPNRLKTNQMNSIKDCRVPNARTDQRRSHKTIEAYSDADWGNSAMDRRSLTGYVFKAYDSTVSWSTKKQSTVSLSSTEAELIALCMATCHGIWIVRLLKDLDINLENHVTYLA